MLEQVIYFFLIFFQPAVDTLSACVGRRPPAGAVRLRRRMRGSRPRLLHRTDKHYFVFFPNFRVSQAQNAIFLFFRLSAPIDRRPPFLDSSLGLSGHLDEDLVPEITSSVLRLSASGKQQARRRSEDNRRAPPPAVYVERRTRRMRRARFDLRRKSSGQKPSTNADPIKSDANRSTAASASRAEEQLFQVRL